MKSIIIIGLLFISLLQASPTENEFIPCKKMSVALLEGCLDKKPRHKNKSCWKMSKNSYDSCYKSIMLSHDREAMAKRKAAKRKAEDSLKADVLKKESLKKMDEKPSYASHSFVLSGNGHNKERTKQKTMQRAKERALLECKEHNSSRYRIKPARCSINKGKQHEIWNCMTIVSCFID